MTALSIRVRLLLVTLAGITVVWSVALALSYARAADEVGEWDDARLVQLATMLAKLDAADLAMLAKDGVETRTEYPRRGATDDAADTDKQPRRAWFVVEDRHGAIVASPPFAVSGIGIGIGIGAGDSGGRAAPRPVTMAGVPWRAYAFHDAANGRTVRVFEPANERSDLVSGVAWRIARPVLLSLPVIALLLGISVSRSLAPISALSAAVSMRDANRLDPIDARRAPKEVRPLVEAINHLLGRLHRSLQRERAFTADAAHELKTPLAAIKVQAQVALAADDVALQRIAMQRVVHGVDRSTHLVKQLLVLARLDESEALPVRRMSLARAVRAALDAHRDGAAAKGIGLALIGEAAPEILADPTLVSVLLANLIDNAIKYGRSGGTVELVLEEDARRAALTVRDDGPGVSGEDRSRLTDRFFRVVGSRASGSGLGLSIVARIAQRFGGQLSFGPGIDGRGLAVRVVFPGLGVAPERADR
jgi:two-component system sensor histidine kinase QseC